MGKIAEAEKWQSLEDIWDNAWAMLVLGATDATDPFHTPVLGTVSPPGCSVRTVVLRRIIPAERILICHTDLRSDKVQEIQRNPRASWLFYHSRQKVQLRLTGQATLHTADELADQQWAASALTSRRTYCAVDRPGAPSNGPTSGLPEPLLLTEPTWAESEAGRTNFTVIACRVDFMDWLYLRAEKGHLRAQFTWRGDELSATWVVP
jgi:hypothetical protein